MNNRPAIILTAALAVLLAACEPTPHYELDNVTISSSSQVISSGFIEHVFTTDKDAYYLIGIEHVREGYNPTDPGNQKQFMTLELDSAHMEYLDWRRQVLQKGEFNVATFASHALQYGETDYYFTGLKHSTDYWIYAFVVDPERMVPTGKLHAVQVRTTETSTIEVHFAYRVKGEWDYVYPQDPKGHIEAHYPYIMATLDSAEIAQTGVSPQFFFGSQESLWTKYPEYADLLYGVHARRNNGFDGEQEFEPGHVYYTYICGFDDGFFHPTLYKFRWEDNQTEIYFTDTKENNLYNYTDRW